MPSMTSDVGSGTISMGTSSTPIGGAGLDMLAVNAPLATSEAIEEADPTMGRPMLHDAPGCSVANPERFSSSILDGVLVLGPNAKAPTPSSSMTKVTSERTTSLIVIQSIGDRQSVAQSNRYASNAAGRESRFTSSTSPSAWTCQTNGFSCERPFAANMRQISPAAARRLILQLKRGSCRMTSEGARDDQVLAYSVRPCRQRK